MVLHANPRILFPLPRQYRRDLSRFMHLHENYPIKRAGVAGVENETVSVIQSIQGNLIVEIKGVRIALDKSLANRIMV